MYLFFCFKISFNILNFFFILLYISKNSLFPYSLLNCNHIRLFLSKFYKLELFPLLHHIFFNNFLLSLNIFIISSIYSFLVTDFLHSYGNGKLICFAIKFIKIDLGASKMLDSV